MNNLMKTTLKFGLIMLALAIGIECKVSLHQLNLKETKNKKIPERQLAGNSQAMLDAQDTRKKYFICKNSLKIEIDYIYFEERNLI